MRIRSSIAFVVGALMAGLFFACGDDSDAGNEASIEASEYKFEVKDELRPGTNEITFKNTGKEVHHLQLVQLLEGKKLNDLAAALSASDAIPSWVKLAGGVGTQEPGKSGRVVGDLDAGTYALLCFISGDDDEPHFAKGMALELQVTGDRASGKVPKGDRAVTAGDYSFEVPGTVKAGEVALRLDNAGREAHELALFELPKGLTFEQVRDIFTGKTPPPDDLEEPASPGGVQAIAPGTSQVAYVDLKKGTYVLACFIPNAQGKPHSELGMIAQLRVE